MRILIAEDDPVSRRILEAKLLRWGYEVVAVSNGSDAWQALEAGDAPRLAIFNWMMPGMEGVDVCRRARTLGPEAYTYIIILTALDQEKDLVAGMEAGADDYLTKPFRADELRVRLRAGERILAMQNELIAAREAQKLLVGELQDALARVKTLSGLLPICSVCKKIRDDKGYWSQLEAYMSEHADVFFSHGYCPECFKERMAEVEALKKGKTE